MEILHDRTRVPLSVDAQFGIVLFEIEFLGEMHWPGTVEVGTGVEHVGRSSLTMAQSLFVANQRVASARSIVVIIDRATRRATPWPEETASALRALAVPLNAKTRRNGIAGHR